MEQQYLGEEFNGIPYYTFAANGGKVTDYVSLYLLETQVAAFMTVSRRKSLMRHSQAIVISTLEDRPNCICDPKFIKFLKDEKAISKKSHIATMIPVADVRAYLARNALKTITCESEQVEQEMDNGGEPPKKKMKLSLLEDNEVASHVVINKCQTGTNQTFAPMIQFNLSGGETTPEDMQKWSSLAQSLMANFSKVNYSPPVELDQTSVSNTLYGKGVNQVRTPTIQFNICK